MLICVRVADTMLTIVVRWWNGSVIAKLLTSSPNESYSIISKKSRHQCDYNILRCQTVGTKAIKIYTLFINISDQSWYLVSITALAVVHMHMASAGRHIRTRIWLILIVMWYNINPSSDRPIGSSTAHWVWPIKKKEFPAHFPWAHDWGNRSELVYWQPNPLY